MHNGLYVHTCMHTHTHTHVHTHAHRHADTKHTRTDTRTHTHTDTHTHTHTHTHTSQRHHPPPTETMRVAKYWVLATVAPQHPRYWHSTTDINVNSARLAPTRRGPTATAPNRAAAAAVAAAMAAGLLASACCDMSASPREAPTTVPAMRSVTCGRIEMRNEMALLGGKLVCQPR